MMHIETLATVIKDRRRLLKIDQQDLAELAGISLRAVRTLESGSGNPRLATINAIAKPLGLMLDIAVGQSDA